MVANIKVTGWGEMDGLTEFKNKLYFCANVGPYGEELWVYDGTNPPSIVADINPDGDSWAGSLKVFPRE